MEHRPSDLSATIDPQQFGVSFSLKQCRNFGLDPRACLQWLLDQGWRRFRLMSYWDEHEKEQGAYDYTELEWQLQMIADAGGSVSLCLGAKQPRWPEYHWPDWAWRSPKAERDKALLTYVGQTVAHVRRWDVIESWQLENEALLKGFGEGIDIDRQRLRQELAIVRQLDPVRPVIMSTSNGWGIPLRPPIPDVVGFSNYSVMYKNGKYRHTIQRPWLHRLRAHFIHVLLGKPVFVHELQAEPWGPKAIWKMDTSEQDKSMSSEQLQRNIDAAQRIKAYPIDLWGAEWWYWRWLQGDARPAGTVRSLVTSPAAPAAR